MASKTTLSVIKADVGGFVGHCDVHPEILARAEECLADAKASGLIVDYHRGKAGDDVVLIMSHRQGTDNEAVHKFAWDTFEKCTAVAKKLGQYGAGQDLLADAWAGNITGMGPGIAEMEFEERPSEPVLIYMADKTEPGAWNMPLYKMFADPFNTPGLVIDPSMHDGFHFEIDDLIGKRKVMFSSPEEIYDLLCFLGAPGHYCVKAVLRKADGEIAATTSTQRLNLMAGRYIGKDDPVMVVRCQSGFPAVGEALEPFSFPHTVAGWMRGSHTGPLMPVSAKQDTPARFDGPPRVVCLGFQVKDAELGQARDMFDDISFDNSRKQALWAADYLRRHGPFEPHRLPLSEMEYTSMPGVLKKIEHRWVDEIDYSRMPTTMAEVPADSLE